MITLSLIAIVSSILSVLYYFWRKYNQLKCYPPGPWGLPILGYLPWIDRNLYRMTRDAEKKYGPISSVQLGQYLVVFFHSVEVAREALIKCGDLFAGRPNLFWLVYTNKRRGIVPTDGDTWRTIRRYTATSMRDFGMGKLSLEGKIHEEMLHVYEKIEQHNGRPFRPTQMMANAVCNVICSILYGNRMDYDDPVFQELSNNASEGFGMGQSAILNWLPWLQYVPPFKKQKEVYDRLKIPFFDTTYAAIDRAEKLLEAGEKPTNFVEAFIDEVRKGGLKAETLKEHCIYTINQLFIAANETTTTTLEWAILLLVINPHVQERMQQEIDKVVGKERLPSWEDRAQLPYVEATMYEILRTSNILVVPLPHRCIETVTFRGYVIPKDAVVFTAAGCWAMDKEYFPNPLEFNPENFLTPAGTVDYKKPIAPFGMGKRECVGEALAKMELYNFIAALVQRYTLVAGPGQKMEYIDCAKREGAWTTHPPPYEIVAVRR